ncbi:hypothetical protein [Noviherbaspirillum galbum]|uniref:GAF domain-containing protein n=1 Tax=Noviherbaspirillum galbum TaxID=2709383 RepID=A0A6B3SXZ1_9BURK|nr:hypothetical protein [Noviherbaspirillum galbum]NEX63442.1 hypothetical protein [Noviherbaspirillum galbum]
MTLAPLTLDDAVHTADLVMRIDRPLSCLSLDAMLPVIAEQAPNGWSALLEATCRSAMTLLSCTAAGVSVLVDEDTLVSECVVGRAVYAQGSRYLTDQTPCGYAMAENAIQLFRYPARRFAWMQRETTFVQEALVVPIHFEDAEKADMAIWAMSDDRQKQFDRQDAYVLASLGKFISLLR